MFKFIVFSELCIARENHCWRSRQELCYFTSSCQDLSIIYLRAVNCHLFNQSDLDTRSWYHGTAASIECLQAPMRTPSSPDRYRFIPFALDCTWLSPAGACSQAKWERVLMKPNYVSGTVATNFSISTISHCLKLLWNLLICLFRFLFGLSTFLSLDSLLWRALRIVLQG